jgi:hypothetical protein
MAGPVNQQDVERIARGVIKELGIAPATLTVAADARDPALYRIEFGGATIKVKCGQGTPAQWVRTQIFEQFLSR